MYEINTCTNDKQVDISYADIITSTLINLGFRSISNKGFFYYKTAILLALYLPEDNIVLNEIYNTISLKYNKPAKKIQKNINNLFERLNTTLLKENFHKTFNLEFDYSYVSPKNLLILILNLIKI